MKSASAGKVVVIAFEYDFDLKNCFGKEKTGKKKVEEGTA
jgi:hypothetical protein